MPRAMLRTFIAVKIPPSPALRQLLNRIAGLSPKLRPIAAGNLHVTLKFLGDTEEALVPEICAALQAGLAAHTAADVQFAGMGAFPNLRRPSVFWVGIQDGGKLAQMTGSLDAVLQPLGFFPEQRTFHPHLTVLRVKFRPPPAVFELAAENETADFGGGHLGTVEYLRSELQPGGSKYTPLASIALRAIGDPT